MDAAPSLPTPNAGAVRSTDPSLPRSAPRPVPRMEARGVQIDLGLAPRPRRTSMRAYLTGAVLLIAASVAGWFALGAYIYG